MTQTVSSWLVKYSAPSKFCKEAYGQIWQQMHDDEEYTLHIQVSKDPENPEWLTMMRFLQIVFSEKIFLPRFVEQCLEDYQDMTTPGD